MWELESPLEERGAERDKDRRRRCLWSMALVEANLVSREQQRVVLGKRFEILSLGLKALNSGEFLEKCFMFWQKRMDRCFVCSVLELAEIIWSLREAYLFKSAVPVRRAKAQHRHGSV